MHYSKRHKRRRRQRYHSGKRLHYDIQNRKFAPKPDQSASVVFVRKLRYPSYLRKKQRSPTHRSYDDYGYEDYDYDYDYFLPIEFQTGEYHFDLYDEQHNYDYRDYYPLNRAYGYEGQGYRHQKTEYPIFPLLALFGFLGILLNIGLGNNQVIQILLNTIFIQIVASIITIFISFVQYNKFQHITFSMGTIRQYLRVLSCHHITSQRVLGTSTSNIKANKSMLQITFLSPTL